MTSDLLEWSHEVAPRGGNLRGPDDTLLGGVAVAKPICLEDGCEEPARCKGRCSKHYLRVTRGYKNHPVGQVEPCAYCGQRFDPYAHRGKKRLYCSERCREAAYRARRNARRPTFGLCEAEDCETPRRSKNARWCEMHYMRWYRGNPIEDGRLRGGICRHCGKATPNKRHHYCSQLCKTRTRVGVEYAPDRPCVICDTAIPHEARYNRTDCCSTRCTDTLRLVESYGITAGQYRAMEKSQAGKCAVCQKPAGKLRIDHHHGDGVVRGLLCNRCNLGLGLFLDDPASLRRAATYLDGRLF